MELKGRSSNVKKGIEQIMLSIEQINKLVPIDLSRINGFVIGSATPKSKPSINILKRRFKQKYKKDIIVKTRNEYSYTVK